MSHKRNRFMRLGNKILIIIFSLVILNLLREYVFVKPKSAKTLSINAVPINFNVSRKEWSYYSGVFNKKAESIKPVKILLPLILHGTVISDPQRSFAVIEADGKQDLYKLGDMVSGAKIVAMNRNKVVLDFNGAKQELTVGMSEDHTAATMELVQPSRTPLTFPSFAGMDFAKIMTELRIKPYFSGGKCVGFQLNNINNNFIKQMGLQDGDVVESINGVGISDPLKALEILYGIQKNNPVHLGVERNDEKIELNCKVEG